MVHFWVNGSARQMPAGRHGDVAGWTLSAAYLCGSAVWGGSRGLKLRDVTNVGAPLEPGGGGSGGVAPTERSRLSEMFTVCVSCWKIPPLPAAEQRRTAL